jgi:hypothetical protein
MGQGLDGKLMLDGHGELVFALHAFSCFDFWRENRQKAGWLSWTHFLNDCILSNSVDRRFTLHSYIYYISILASHIMPLAIGSPVLQPMTAADPTLDVRDWLQSIPVEI